MLRNAKTPARRPPTAAKGGSVSIGLPHRQRTAQIVDWLTKSPGAILDAERLGARRARRAEAQDGPSKVAWRPKWGSVSAEFIALPSLCGGQKAWFLPARRTSAPGAFSSIRRPAFVSRRAKRACFLPRAPSPRGIFQRVALAHVTYASAADTCARSQVVFRCARASGRARDSSPPQA